MKEKNCFDVIIVGAGPGGIFCALEIARKSPDKKVLLIERGKAIEKRRCPAKKAKKCLHCRICNTMSGFAGAGAFSDGKLHWYLDDFLDIPVGGNLHKYIGVDLTKEYSKIAHDYYVNFGATEDIEGMKNLAEISDIKNHIENVPGLNLPIVPVRHIGTEKLHEIFKSIEDYLLEKCENITVFFNTEMKDLIVEDSVIKGIVTKSTNPECQGDFFAPNVVLAVGRSGATDFVKMSEKYDINTLPGTIDIGVRVEVPREVLRYPCKILYELKILAKTPTYKDQVRTFCMNDGGFVTSEKTSGIVCVNGHANKVVKSKNTNFAILVSLNFNDIDKPMVYMESVGKAVNLLGLGTALVQRLGDIKAGKRTWPEELKSSNQKVKPTLNAAKAGDLTLAFPARIMTDILEMLEMMDKAVPGVADDSTLLYGPEMKFYGIRPVYKDPSKLESNIQGLYAIGDGCGLTRGLVQASASGILVARAITENTEE